MREPKVFAVYLMTNRPRGVLYVGVTSDLRNRANEHRTGYRAGFTDRYNLHRLVWAEWHQDAREAIAREKRLKRWRREWKFALVEEDNPEWGDLFPALFETTEHVIPDGARRSGISQGFA